MSIPLVGPVRRGDTSGGLFCGVRLPLNRIVNDRLNGVENGLVRVLFGIPQVLLSFMPGLALRGLTKVDSTFASIVIGGVSAVAPCVGAGLYRCLRPVAVADVDKAETERRFLFQETMISNPLSIMIGTATFLGQYAALTDLGCSNSVSIPIAGISSVAMACLSYFTLSNYFAKKENPVNENRYINPLWEKGKLLMSGLLGSAYFLEAKEIQLSQLVAVFTIGLGIFASQSRHQPRERQVIYA